MNPMRSFFVAMAILTAGISPAASASDNSVLCNEFRALGWPKADKLGRFVLTNTLQLGAKEDSINHFYNLDLDGDDVEDVVTVGCSASLIPADPCILESKLSSGGSINFEAWHLYLIRHRGLIYAITANENGTEKKIYRTGPKDMGLVCSAP